MIVILPYDPFGRDRMVYTIQNGCVEEPDLPYEDGARTIFLYTKGTKGDPPEELRQLLNYMEKSRPENAVNPELREMHRMVECVKQDREVLLSFMKVFEREAMLLRQGREEEQKNTERERQRADAAESRADAAESRADAAEAQLRQLKEELEKLKRTSYGRNH